MADEHEQYVALAVGHVLGGLDAVDAATFQAHLQGCRECRSRVAELRGIAATLAAVEEDERSRRPLRTELPPQVERLDDETSATPEEPRGIQVRHVTVAALVVLALAAATAFWNFHLRTMVSTAALVADQREETLIGLADGVPVQADLAEGVRGLVVVGDDRVAFVLSELGSLGPEDRLIASISGGSLSRPEVVRVADRAQLDGASFSGATAFQDAERLTITRETRDGAATTLMEAEIAEPRPVATGEGSP